MQASDLSPVPASLCLRQEVIRVPQSKCDGGGGGCVSPWFSLH